jgi:Flp pilus assembly protein TadG
VIATRLIRDDRGTQIAELALVLPLLLFLGLAVSEGAGMMRVHQVLNNAAREAAHASTLQENLGQIGALQQIAIDYCARNGVTISANQVTVNQAVPIAMANGVFMVASRVQVSYPYSLTYMPRLPFFNTPSSFTLAGAAEFRNFY